MSIPAWLSFRWIWKMIFNVNKWAESNTTGHLKEKVSWRLEIIVFVRISPFSSKTFKLRNRESLLPRNDSFCASLQRHNSALVISLAVNSWVLFTWILRQLFTNLNIHAIVHRILEYIENLCKYQGTVSSLSCSTEVSIAISSIVVSGNILSLHRPGVLRNSKLTMFSSISPSSLGHSLGGSFNHSGPSHHFSSRNFLASQPREGKSAGFITPGTYLQDLISVRLLISRTRFHTKTAHCLVCRIHVRMVIESLQK